MKKFFVITLATLILFSFLGTLTVANEVDDLNTPPDDSAEVSTEGRDIEVKPAPFPGEEYDEKAEETETVTVEIDPIHVVE
ncbi:MAG: hypothetical protein ACOCZX_03450 [Candidatus Bipolaricaulota bacterium]